MELSSHHKSIVAYLKDEDGSISLSDKQEELLDKFQTAYALLLKHKSSKVAANVMAKMDQWNSIFTAQRDLRIAEQIFGDINESTKLIKRQIATEMALECFEVAKKGKNVDQMNKAIRNYIMANGLNKDEVDMPDFDKLVIPESPIVIDIDFLKAYADQLDASILDKIRSVLESSKIFKYIPELAETIPFTETKNDK